MFKSKRRQVITPQYEHGKFAGLLAAHWGNAQFRPPPLEAAGFIQGVTFHDWGYGLLDNAPIGETSEDDWLKIVEKGVGHQFLDPTADIVAKLHIRRLLCWASSDARSALISKIDQLISPRLSETQNARVHFEQADLITKLCDFIAFDFAFEAPKERTVVVYSDYDSLEEVEIRYRVHSEEIFVSPWPFDIPLISGLIIGYHEAGYPDVLQPLTIPFRILPT